MTIAPPDTPPQQAGTSRFSRNCLPWSALIAALTVMRLVYAGVIDLRTDEAYYWTWSKENVLSFLDHPPMIAWFIRFGTAIFGDTNLGVRFAGILAMLVTQLLLADIVRRVTHDFRAVVLAVLMPEAALYYGLLMAKVSPDVALIPFAVAMMWSLVRLTRAATRAGGSRRASSPGWRCCRNSPCVMLLPAVLAFMLVPDWRRRWLLQSLSVAGGADRARGVLAGPDLEREHDWASFRFQFVRATATHEWSLRTLGEFHRPAIRAGRVRAVAGGVVGVALTAWRGYRTREPVAILLSTAVIVPFAYFFWKSLTLRVGDTWPMFIWPAGFAAAAINIAMLPREGWSGLDDQIDGLVGERGDRLRHRLRGVRVSLLRRQRPGISSAGPIRSAARPVIEQVVGARAKRELQKTGATWIATTDYRTYAMLRWYFNGRVPVIQINERGRFHGLSRSRHGSDPGPYRPLCRARARQYRQPLWASTTAVSASRSSGSTGAGADRSWIPMRWKN